MRMFEVILEKSFLAYTKYGSRKRIILKVRPIAPANSYTDMHVLEVSYV